MWTFTFYDVDHDGVISKEEMLKVCSYPISQHQIQNGVKQRHTNYKLK